MSATAPATAQPARPTRREDPKPSLSHFVIFNPSLALKQQPNPSDGTIQPKDAKSSQTPDASSPVDQCSTLDQLPLPLSQPQPSDERDRDLEDDIREASQIVFYTSREAGGVSRDKMLRQVGLAKGLMGFAECVRGIELVGRRPLVVGFGVDKDSSGPVYWAIHSQTQRLIVYSPEPDWFIYICISLPREVKHDPKDKDAPKPADPVQFTDRMLVDGLQRGYEDFCLLHATLGAQLPPTLALSALLERYWTRFAFAYEAAYVSPGPTSPLLTWLGGWPPAAKGLKDVRRALKDLVEDSPGCVGLVSTTGPLAVAGDVPEDDTTALTRFLINTLTAGIPPVIPRPETKGDRHSLGFGFGRRKARETPLSTHDPRKPSWSLHPLSWVGLGAGAGASASAPASRTATPVQPPTPSPTVGPKGTVTEDADKASPKLPPTVATPQPKPRWPSLGLGGIGDAMGNMGAALGLSTAPSPKSDEETKGAGEAKSPPGDEVKPVEGQEPVTAEEALTDKSQGEDPKPGGEEQGRADDASQLGSPNLDTLSTHDFGSHSMSSRGSMQLPEAADDERADDTVPELATSLPHSIPIPTTAVDDDAISIRSRVSQSDVALPELVLAVESQVNLTWQTRLVWISGVQKRLHWVTRDKALLFALGEIDAPTPPTLGAQAVFAAYAVYAAKLKPSPPVTDTTIYHRDSLTDVEGVLESRESTVLAGLRRGLDDNVSEVYAQTSGGRLVVAKRAEEAELYVVTGRRDASLTDAERVVRRCVLARPEFTS